MNNEDTPKIIGVIYSKKISHELAKKIHRSLGVHKKSYVILPLKVEKKYLKNLYLCIKLMDIEGIVVTEEHKKNIIKLVKRENKDCKMINYIKREKNELIGYYIEEDKNFYKRIACVIRN